MATRSLHIDVSKGLLTMGMVFAHVIQLLGNGGSTILKIFSFATNLVSFSGFLLCFGFAAWSAYLDKPRTPWISIIKTIVKCYIAFIISGAAFLILAESESPTFNMVLRIALLRDIPGYSEFLLSFAIVTALATIFRRLTVAATENLGYLWFASVVCLAFTFLPAKVQYDPIVGELIGGEGFSYFPVIQYLPIFLLGVFISRHAITLKPWFLAAAVGAAILILVPWAEKSPASRFPPSSIWIISSAGLAFVYLAVAHAALTRLPKILIIYLNIIGQNVLLYLLISNIAIFSARALSIANSLTSLQAVFFYVLLMALILFLQIISIDPKKSSHIFNKST